MKDVLRNNGTFVATDYGTTFISDSDYIHYRDEFIQDGMTPLSYDDYVDMRTRAFVDEKQSEFAYQID